MPRRFGSKESYFPRMHQELALIPLRDKQTSVEIHLCMTELKTHHRLRSADVETLTCIFR